MTPEPRHPPIVPSYGAAALADLSSSMLASLDPEAPESQNVLGLPSTRRACLLIVDGLGWELLRDHPAVAPFLSELARNSRPITAGFPSTTVTSLGSICTGQPPGQHGILGYQVMIPGENRLLNGLRWDSRIDPRQWQPLPTIYERAVAAGIAAVHVTQGAFRGTGLTVATMRGADFRPADSMGALAAQAATALGERPRVRDRIPRRPRWHRARVRGRLGRLVQPAGPRGQAGRAAGQRAALGYLHVRDRGPRHGGRRGRG